MFDTLKTQFEETKQKLQDVEKTIRRITGRDPDLLYGASSGNGKFWHDPSKPNLLARKRAAAPFIPKKEVVQEEEPEEFEEDSPDEESSPKKRPAVQSTIVSHLKDVKTRRAKMEEQKKDRRILARNRRMFGVMLGTLQKFQSEESRRLEQAQKRAEIDKKLEEAAEKEKIQAKKEKEQLFITRREKQTQIRCLEKKMEIAEIHEVWEKSHMHLLNFIQTESEPKIMFLPTKHNTKSEKCLKDSKEKIIALMESNSERVQKELEEIDELYRKDDSEMVTEDAVDKENIGPPDTVFIKQEEVEEEENESLVVNGGDGVEENDEETRTRAHKKEADLLPVENPESDTSIYENMERTESTDATGGGGDDETDKKLADHEEFEPIYDE